MIINADLFGSADLIVKKKKKIALVVGKTLNSQKLRNLASWEYFLD